MSKSFRVTAMAVLAAALPLAAQAQGAEQWKWQASLYGYFPSIGGKTAFPVAGGGSNISVSSDDIVGGLKFAFMGTLEARRGQWGLFTDVFYADIAGSGSNTRDFSLEPNAGIAADLTLGANLDLKSLLWTLAGSYALIDSPSNQMQMLVGTRMASLDQTLDYRFNGTLAGTGLTGRTGSASVSDTNWDAIVGLKGKLAFGAAHQWVMPYYADIGTGDSDLTWQGLLGFGYEDKSWGAFAAWRYIRYEMKSGQPIQSLSFDGPMFGIAFRW